MIIVASNTSWFTQISKKTLFLNMKNLTTLILTYLFIFTQSGFSQDVQLRDIYDFDIGDEFHYQYYPEWDYSKYINRYFVIDKNYSENLDTVYYTFRIEDYNYFNAVDTIFESYHIDTITKSYGNLDTFLISNYFNNISDSIICYELDTSQSMCDRKIYQFRYTPGCYTFHEQLYEWRYAEGLGLIKFYNRLAFDWYEEEILIYYKKGEEECGKPDYSIVKNTAVNINNEVSVFPNPFTEEVTIKSEYKIDKILIFNNRGKIIHEKRQNENSLYNLKDIIPGIYFCKIITAKGSTFKKIIKQ